MSGFADFFSHLLQEVGVLVGAEDGGLAGGLVTPRTAAHQAPLSMEFSRQEYWSGMPFPSPGYLPIPGMEPTSPALQAGSLLSDPPGKPQGSLKIWSTGGTSFVFYFCKWW